MSGLRLGHMVILLAMLATARAKVPSGLDLKLLQAVTSDLSKNQAISPFVMSSLMTQVWLGARGSTRDEMTPVLGISGQGKSSFLPAYKNAIADLSIGSSTVTTSVFNRIYARTGFTVKPTFITLLKNYYNADVRRFSSATQASSEINNAVAKVTRNRIKNLISESDLQSAQMVLVSALYFKSSWQYRFKNTVKGPFLTSSGSKQVDMMKVRTRLPYVKMRSFDAVSLPYEDKDYCMLVIRPLKRSMSAVIAVRNSIDSLSIPSIIKQLTRRMVRVSMPRFTLKTEYSLESTMPLMGITRIFSPRADFSGITDGPLMVSKIIHKVFMEVTEEGTEAAGAGAVVMLYSRSRDVPFLVDRPFFAIVFNKKHAVNLFSAYVASP